MCCYREAKNFDRFVRLTQSVVLCTLQQLRTIRQKSKPPDEDEVDVEKVSRTAEEEEEEAEERKQSQLGDVEESEKRKRENTEHSEKNRETMKESGGRRSSDSSSSSKHHWSQQDREKLFHLLSKIFLLNFPLYIAMKHGGALNPLAPVKVPRFFMSPALKRQNKIIRSKRIHFIYSSNDVSVVYEFLPQANLLLVHSHGIEFIDML